MKQTSYRFLIVLLIAIIIVLISINICQIIIFTKLDNCCSIKKDLSNQTNIQTYEKIKKANQDTKNAISNHKSNNKEIIEQEVNKIKQELENLCSSYNQ